MSDLTKQSELKELADHIEAEKIGWLPTIGSVVNFTMTLSERDTVLAALRSSSSAGAREALESIDAILDAVWSTNDRAEEVDGLVKIKAIIRSALSDHGVQIRAGIEPSPAVIESLKSGIERQRDDGFWRSCSGCFETVDGYSSQPVDEIFNCQLGCGCRQCGGIGAVWDNTDYDDMVSFMLAEDEADERNERIRKALEFYADPFKSQFTY